MVSSLNDKMSGLPLLITEEQLLLPGSITSVDLSIDKYKKLLSYRYGKNDLVFLLGFKSSFDKNKVIPYAIKVLAIDISCLSGSRVSILLQALEVVSLQKDCLDSVLSKINISSVSFSQVPPWSDLPSGCDISFLKKDLSKAFLIGVDNCGSSYGYSYENLIVLKWLEAMPIPNEVKFDFLSESDATNAILLLSIMMSIKMI